VAIDDSLKACSGLIERCTFCRYRSIRIQFLARRHADNASATISLMNTPQLLGVLLLAFSISARAAVCPLPDLTKTIVDDAPAVFEVIEAADRSLRVKMTDNLAEPPALLAAEPSDGPPPRPIPPSLRWLYSEATGWLLVPRMLQVRTAAVGIDGSWTLRMDNGKGARLSMTSTGSCLGCAVAQGSGWFPALAEQARAMEIEPCTVFRPRPERVPQGTSRVRFNYLNGGVRHDGVVLRKTGRDELGDVRELLVSGLPLVERDAVLQRF
jgi:hypothetical protein